MWAAIFHSLSNCFLLMLWIFLILDFSRDYFTFQLLLFSTAIIEGSRTKNKSSGKNAWSIIVLGIVFCWKDHTPLDAWSENKVVMIMKFSHGVLLAASNKFGLVVFLPYHPKGFWLSAFFHVVLMCNNYMDMCLYLLNILILHIWLLEF